MESHENFQQIPTFISEMNTDSIRVNYIVTDNARNSSRALNPDELSETVQVLLGDKVFHVRCDYNSANLALEDLG
jgi:hypothetical protein